MATAISDNWATNMATARRLTQSGKPEQARDIIHKIKDAAPTVWQGLIYLAQAELECGNFDVACHLRKEAEQASASQTALAQFDIRHALRLGDTAEAANLGKSALAQNLTLDFPTLLQLGDDCIEQGLGKDAMFFADHALTQGCNVIRVYRIKYIALIMSASDENLETDLATSMFSGTETESHTVALVVLIHFRPAALDIARRLLDKAKKKWPTSERLKNVRNVINSIDQERPSDPEEHLKMIATGLRRVEDKLPYFTGLGASFLRLKTADFSRPLISNYNPAGFALSENSGTGDVMVFFKGIGANVNTLDATDAYASTAGMSAVYLEDTSRLFFCNGAPALGQDLESSLTALQELIDGFGPRRSLTMLSASAGAIGALLYGTRLKADRILCFSAITHVNRKFLDAQGDKRARAVVHRVEKHVPPEMLNVKTQLQASDHCPQIDLVFGAGHVADRAHATHIEDHPGVSLYPIAGFNEHPTLQHAMLNGYFLDTLRGKMSRVPV